MMKVAARTLVGGLLIGLLAIAPASAGTSDFRVANRWPQPTWKLDGASGVAIDAAGNVYMADTLNDRVAKFDATGRFVTAWGTSGSADGNFKGPKGIAVNKSGTNVYVVDTGNHRVQQFTSSGQFVRKWGKAGGPDLSGSGPGEFNAPEGVALDSAGSVYVADTGNARVQKFSAAGAFLRQWGRPGSGDGLFLKPSDVAVSGAGQVFVCDRDRTNSYVQQFDSEGAFVRSWGGWRSIFERYETSGRLRYPSGVAVSDDGAYLYVTETGDDCVSKYDVSQAQPTLVTRFGFTGYGDTTSQGRAAMRTPWGIAVRSTQGATKLYVCDTGNDRVRVFTDAGTADGINGSWGEAHGRFETPSGLAVLPNGAVLVGDTKNHRVQQFRSDGAVEWAAPDYVPNSSGNLNDRFKDPKGVAADGIDLFVADSGNHRIMRIQSNGTYSNKWGAKGTGDGFFESPSDVAAGMVSGSRRVFVADAGNSRIQVFDTDGVFVGKWGRLGSQTGELNKPQAVALDSAGNVYVADTGNHRVQKFTAGGAHVATWGRFGSAPGSFDSPAGVCVDSAGNVYIADTGNHRIQKLSPAGAVLAVFGSRGTEAGQFDGPAAVDIGASGLLYVADTGNHRIQALAPPITVSIRGVVEGGVYNTTVIPTIDFIGTGILETRVTLNGGAWTPNPLSTPGRHTLVGWARDAVAESSAEVRFIIDTKPPVTSSNAMSTPYSEVATITLSATDDLSGVGTTYWRLGQGDQVSGTVAVINTVGTHTLSFWSSDKAGNLESPKSVTVTVRDGTPPVTTSDARAEYPDAASIRLTAVDAGGATRTFFRVDGGAQQEGTVALVSGLGSHTVQFWSVDQEGNTEVANSVSFVIKRGARLTISTSASKVGYQGRVTVRGTLSRASDTVGLAARRVEVLRSYDGVRFKRIATVTGAGDVYSYVDRPTRNATYRLRFVGDSDYAACQSPTRLVRVKASLTAPSAPTAVTRGKTFPVSGTLKPGHAGSTGGVLIRCYRKEGDRYRLRMEVPAKVAYGVAYSTYRASVLLPSRGAWRLRAYHADGDHAASTSPHRGVSVK